MYKFFSWQKIYKSTRTQNHHHHLICTLNLIPETVISNKFYSIWSTKINQEAFQIQCKYNIQNNSQYILGVVLIYKAKAEKFHQNSRQKSINRYNWEQKGHYVLHSCNADIFWFSKKNIYLLSYKHFYQKSLEIQFGKLWLQ